MASFQVATEALTAASAGLAKGTLDVGGGSASLGGTGGACDGTPAAGAWTAFVDAAGTALTGMHTTSEDLSQALNTAALAYQLSDGTAAAALQVKR